MIFYLTGAVVVAVVTHLYVYTRLPPRSWLKWVLLALGASFPIGMVQLELMRQTPRVLASPLMWFVFSWVGVLYFLLIALLLGHLARLPKSFLPVAIAFGLAIGSAWQCLRAPLVRELEIEIANIEPTRIAHLSDLHIGATLGRSFVQTVVDEVNALDVDYVCITGDLVDGSIEELADEIAPLRTLNAPVYIALGNHEYFSDAPAWAAYFNKLGFHVLKNRHVELAQGFDFVGIDELSAPEFTPAGAPDYDAAFAGRDASRPAIALVHQPRALSELAARHTALQLSGHTHAGQMFPLHWLALLDQPFVEGLHAQGATQIHVNPGTGYWGPPMRLFTRAEISVLTLGSTR